MYYKIVIGEPAGDAINRDGATTEWSLAQPVPQSALACSAVFGSRNRSTPRARFQSSFP